MDKILYIGYAIPKDMVGSVPGASVAGNKMQLNVIKELANAFRLHCISIFPIAAFPRGKDMVVKAKTITLCLDIDTNVPFMVNLPIIKNFSACIHTYLTARKVVKREGVKRILTFNMFPYTAWPALRLKKKYGCEVISLIADLPIDDNVGTKGVKKHLRKWFDNYTKKAITLCDKVIVLNEEASREFAPGIPHIVIEGGVDVEEIGEYIPLKKKRKNILYAGSLQEHNGISTIIEAMELLGPDTGMELDIYGDGELLEYVKKKATLLRNVNYCGIVGNEEIMRLQREAWLLVNPRDVNNKISKVTFPSKTFEYLLSGTPVLTTNLNGYSEEYTENMFVVNFGTPEAFAEQLKRIDKLTDQQMENVGYKAREMIVHNKNWKVQGKKIADWIGA